LRNADIQVSLFLEADQQQIEMAAEIEADVIEIHTGRYAEPEYQDSELTKIQTAATYAESLGLEVHAGHGLRFEASGCRLQNMYR